MIKKLYTFKNFRTIPHAFLFAAVLQLAASPLFAQAVSSILLKDEHIHAGGKFYFISEIKDERPERRALAWLINPISQAQNAAGHSIDLTGGTVNALKHFIAQNLPQNPAGHAIVITIKDLKLTEAVLPANNVQGKVTIALSFGIKYNQDISAHLVDYHSTATYNRSLNVMASANAELMIRHMIESALVYFDNWINIQENDNPKLAKSVKLGFSDFFVKDKAQEDTIYYSPARPITWDDFKAPARTGKYAAEVLPGFGYTENTDVNKGIIRVHLAMKVYMPKSGAAVKPGGKSDYSLNHEQRHFDIVKLVSEHFKEKVAALKLPVYNYDGPINAQYFESFREMNQLQKQYDEDTAHGINEAAQARWNDRIDKELKKYGIIPGRQI